MGFHSPPSATGKPNQLSFLRILHWNLYLDLALKVTWNRDAILTQCQLSSCASTQPESNCLCRKQRWEGQEKWDYAPGSLFRIKPFPPRKRTCESSPHSAAREELHSITKKIFSDPFFPAQELSTAHKERPREPQDTRSSRRLQSQLC